MKNGEASPPAKVERNRQMYADWRAGMKQTEIAEKYGISTTRVSLILRDVESKLAIEAER